MVKSKFPLNTDLLQEVLNTLNLCAYVTDIERNIVVWNRKAEEVTGYSAADVVGTACWDNVLQHVDKDGHELCRSRMCPLLRCMQLGVENEDPVLIYAKRADGHRVAVSASAAPLRDEAGNIVGGIETFRDETRLVADMEFAAKIQRHLFPTRLPETDLLEFDVRYFPHDLVGGDFYDVWEIEPGKFGVLVADVSGHGVSAALYTMWLKILEENFQSRAANPAEMITALNRALGRFVVPESFATAVYAVVDAKNCTCHYCNAGHPVPLHYSKASGEVFQLESHGLPLAVASDESYESSMIDLEPGDLILLYTDGLAEVTDRDGTMLNARRLGGLLADVVVGGRDGLLDRIYQSVLDRSRDVKLADDCMMLSIHRRG